MENNIPMINSFETRKKTFCKRQQNTNKSNITKKRSKKLKLIQNFQKEYQN